MYFKKKDTLCINTEVLQNLLNQKKKKIVEQGAVRDKTSVKGET